MHSSAPPPGAPSPWDSALGATKDSISQCTFLQMTYTAVNPHADGSAAPGARPRFRPPRRRDPHATSLAPTTKGWREDRCPVVSKRPLHIRSAAKMSPHIRIGPEPVLTAHARSPPAKKGQSCEGAELVGVLVAETIHPACMCEGGGRWGEKLEREPLGHLGVSRGDGRGACERTCRDRVVALLK